jgi:hypothetical protein
MLKNTYLTRVYGISPEMTTAEISLLASGGMTQNDALPVSPGCATLMYLQGDSLMVTMSFGDRVLHNTTITGKSSRK